MIDQALQEVRNEMLLRNYSPRTIKNYLGSLRGYFKYSKGNFLNLDEDLIRNFLLEKKNCDLAPQTLNLYLNAIKFYYQKIRKNYRRLEIRFSKRCVRLPVVLSRDEIVALLEVITNRKHWLMIALAYSAGLRVSELVKLRVKDIDLIEKTIWVRQGKGNRDRLTIFSEKLKAVFNEFITGRNFNEFIFVSERGGSLTTRSIQKVFKRALKKAGIQKEATFHSLRHSFATHLIENGVNLRYVQSLLGHRNIRTTMIYTKVTNQALMTVQSPY